MQRTFTVTLTNANQNYSLWSLVVAQDANFIDKGDFVIQADDDAGTQIYRLGDTNISGTVGQEMRSGDFSAHFKSLLGLFARCDTGGKKMNIQVIR